MRSLSKRKLDAEAKAKAKAKDDKAICRLIQEDLEVGGTATYNTSPIGERATFPLLTREKYLVVIIGGGFTVGSDTKVHIGNGLGHLDCVT
ncbi:uncharacterized protein BP5553_06961 [Venustampulla echinocandica]|uniref:Uncharacterized protein n=1 Tax=Venustampulla echinocandica TaxID=2656787 RepID=A0A370TI50_9HELO|nr:uncharacterized protein BP5553_06961 [Venustampulla echinocandica]RDL35030.1 hypothetical protein BP5553_06961 [Venustampulla echinocandica]